ncbi:MAG TPA: VOC family protein [Ktedonobacteraceae bacterium]|nr:VOC family protein [Ktedonobacteraceae bacterium]
MFQGLRTVIYGAKDIAQAKAWYSTVLGIQPYFDEPFYVGFEVGGFELGLEPGAAVGTSGPIAYWGVADADAAYRRLLELGASGQNPIQDVGGDIRIGSVIDPFGNSLGIIYNPNFSFKEGQTHGDSSN